MHSKRPGPRLVRSLRKSYGFRSPRGEKIHVAPVLSIVLEPIALQFNLDSSEDLPK